MDPYLALSQPAVKLASELGHMLLSRRWVITTAESCTGGLVAAAITSVSGSSNWFEQGWVTYANQAKSTLLGVSPAMLAACGAVSEPVVLSMAVGARRAAGAQIAIAVSGIAGPDGGTPEKPVGTVWVAWSVVNQVTDAKRYVFSGDRGQVREAALNAALRGSIARVKIYVE